VADREANGYGETSGLPTSPDEERKPMRYLGRCVAPLALALLAASPQAWSQTESPTCDAIAKMDYTGNEYLPGTGKMRWQENPQTAFERRILRLRQNAIPLLIGCLTDERETKRPVWDLWLRTTVGMIAFSMLCDLFEDPQRGYTWKEVVTWDDLHSEPPKVYYSDDAFWESYLENHGRRSIQQSWQKAWTESKDRIYWDERAKCFRVKKTR
jgi:hypothetical protein